MCYNLDLGHISMGQEGSFSQEVFFPHIQVSTHLAAMSGCSLRRTFMHLLQKKAALYLQASLLSVIWSQGCPAVFTSEKNTGFMLVWGFVTSECLFNLYTHGSYSPPGWVQNATFLSVCLVFLTTWQHTLIVYTRL